MSFAHTHPSLRTRILENQQGMVTLPAGHSGITKPNTQSYTERYRGTEYETHVERVVVSEPLLPRGRALWMVVGSASAVVIGVLLGAAPA